jgi:uncharacterized protein (TIGR03435 family)
MKNWIGLASFLFVVTMSLSNSLHALQSQKEFEVASIKMNASGSQDSGISSNPSNGRFTATNATLKRLIRLAYEVEDFRITGGPDWLDTERFDISAKAEKPGSETELRMMLQSLLADRFRLKFHRDARETSVYALLVAKNGPRLIVSTAEANSIGISRREISGTNMTMPLFASALSGVLNQAVVDKTGLVGKFDLKLRWTPDSVDTPLDPSAPSIFTAVQEQLGLRLDSQKGSVEVFVIDSAEKPIPN